MTDTTASTSQRADDRMEEEHSDSGAAALSSSTGTTTASPLPPLKLRNYRPKDKSIAYVALTRPSYAADSAWLDAELSSLVESAVAHDNADVLLSIAPKSLNWDLKRDLAPKLALLKKQTAKALQELRRQRTQHTAHTSAASPLFLPLIALSLYVVLRGVQRRRRRSRRATGSSVRTTAPDRPSY